MKLTQKEFAQKIGATEKRVNNIENGVIKKLVPLEVEALVSLGFNRSWLLAGQGEMFAPDDHQNKLDGLRKMIREKESGNAKTETYVFRPEVYASAGFGYFNENESTELLCVDDRIAQRLGVKETIEVIQVKGDSMQPKYGDHDLIFVDRSDNMFTSEGIYAILYEGTLMVKYLMRIKNGVRIRSLNRELYDDIDFELNEFNSDTVVIVGRVRGAITFN